MEAVLDELGIGREALAAAGDGANDLELLRLARVSIAMGHAPADVRRAATYVAPSNAADGLAVGLRWLARHHGGSWDG